MVVQGARLVRVPGRAQQQRAGPPAPDLPAGVAADGFQVAVGNLGKVQPEPVPQQPDQVGAAACLYLRLEDRSARSANGDCEAPDRCGNPTCVGERGLVGARCVQIGPCRAQPGWR